MADAEPDPRAAPTPAPSQAAEREVAALRAMLGLPSEERDADESAPPAPTEPDEPIPPDSFTPNSS